MSNWKSYLVFLIAAAGLLLDDCAPVREVPVSPPISFPAPPQPPAGTVPGESKEEMPRRMASLHLTETGRKELEQGDLKKAMDRFEKAIGLDAKNSAAYYFFAEARFRQKEYQQSLTLLERAEELAANDSGWLVRIYLLEGKNLEGLGRRTEAVARFRKVLSIDSSQAEALDHLK